MSDATDAYWGAQTTHVPAQKKVLATIDKVVAAKYSGWKAEDREDLVSLVYEKYFKMFGKGTPPANSAGEPEIPVAWLKTVVKTTAIDLHKKREGRRERAVDFDGEELRSALATALRDLRTPSLLAGRGVAVHEALGRLRERDRELIHRRYVLDESLQPIADATGKNYEATKRAVQRAVGRLRNEILADDELKAALLGRTEHPID